MMLYKNTKVKICSLNGDTDYFDIVAGVLQRYTLAPYLFIICLAYVLKTSIDKMKDNGFKLAKERSRNYPAQKFTDADYTDNRALLANTPAQAEHFFPTSGRVDAAIWIHHMDSNKTDTGKGSGSANKIGSSKITKGKAINWFKINKKLGVKFQKRMNRTERLNE